MHTALRRILYIHAQLFCAFLLFGCTHLAVEDCPPNGVLGNNEPGSARLRTSHYRVMLADPAAAAARFLPYAIMSAYAYKIGDHCDDKGNKVRVSHERDAELMNWLMSTTDNSGTWQLEEKVGMRDARAPERIGCEDDQGLMFHVWHRKSDNQEHVVIAFRGTSGSGDWIYGNLWWLSRAVLSDTQLSRARMHAAEVIRYFDQKAAAEGANPPRYVTTGHSLGGSLAQHVLYAFPDRVEQAIVFDSSSVTGFVDPSISRADRICACACRDELNPEARIIRVYQTYEVLANLRIFHKLILPPERHVQEVRFPFKSSWNPFARHSMYEFTRNLHKASGTRKPDEVGHHWFASRESACTARLIDKQKASCSIVVPPGASMVCPQ